MGVGGDAFDDSLRVRTGLGENRDPRSGFGLLLARDGEIKRGLLLLLLVGGTRRQNSEPGEPVI